MERRLVGRATALSVREILSLREYITSTVVIRRLLFVLTMTTMLSLLSTLVPLRMRTLIQKQQKKKATQIKWKGL